MLTTDRLILADTGRVVAEKLEVADDAWSRMKGLQLRRSLTPGAGLLLVPCASVHTFFMRFAIDVVLLNRRGYVLAIDRAVKPWRFVLPVPGAYATLELPAGSAEFQVGDVLCLESGPRDPFSSLTFLSPRFRRVVLR